LKKKVSKENFMLHFLLKEKAGKENFTTYFLSEKGNEQRKLHDLLLSKKKAGRKAGCGAGRSNKTVY
jgi:hypothetical protein